MQRTQRGHSLYVLDEPTTGLHPSDVEKLVAQLHGLVDAGNTVVIVEHDMPMVMSISDRIYCLEAGQVIAEGTPLEVRENPRVISSYLGTDERAINRSGVITT